MMHPSLIILKSLHPENAGVHYVRLRATETPPPRILSIILCVLQQTLLLCSIDCKRKLDYTRVGYLYEGNVNK